MDNDNQDPKQPTMSEMLAHIMHKNGASFEQLKMEGMKMSRSEFAQAILKCRNNEARIESPWKGKPHRRGQSRGWN